MMNEKLTKLETEVEKKKWGMKRIVRSQEMDMKEKKLCPQQLNYKVHVRGLTQVII